MVSQNIPSVYSLISNWELRFLSLTPRNEGPPGGGGVALSGAGLSSDSWLDSLARSLRWTSRTNPQLHTSCIYTYATTTIGLEVLIFQQVETDPSRKPLVSEGSCSPLRDRRATQQHEAPPARTYARPLVPRASPALSCQSRVRRFAPRSDRRFAGSGS